MLSSRFVRFFILNLIILLPSCRLLLKFFNIYVLIAYAIGLNLFFLFSLNNIERVKFLSKKIWLYFLPLVTCLAYFIYPKVDGRKTEGKIGSTADDAFILGAESFRNTGKIYDVQVNDLAPTSPGPGWILINSPWVYFGLYVVFLMIYFILSTYFVNKKEGSRVANIFVLFCISSLLFWELLFNGHDIIPLSFAVFLVAYLFDAFMKTNKLEIGFILLAIFTGLLSTSRIVFVILPALYLSAGWFKNRNKSMLFFVVSQITCAAFHLYFYSINIQYQPLHLLIKAYDILGYMGLSVLTIVILLSLILFSRFKEDISAVELSFVILSLILVPISLIDLIRFDFNFKIWEGANYLYPLVPLFIYLLIKSETQRVNQLKA